MKNRVNPLVLMFAAVLMFSGCASTEWLSPADEAVVGSAWNADAGVSLSDELPAVARSEWWKAWKDAELSALVDRAMAESTDVRTALANLKTAAASADQATADLFPTLKLGADGSRTHRENQGTTENWSAEASGSWSISLLGGNLAVRRAARYEAMASLLTLEDVKNAVAAEAASDYVALKLAFVKRRIAEATLKNYEEAGNIARWRFEAGLSDQSEVDQAVSNREGARAALALTEKSIAQYKNALARLTVQNAADIRVTDDGLVPTAPLNLAVAVPAEMLKNRPDLRAAQLTVVAASERVYKAKTQWFPSLSLSGNIGTQAATIGTLGASGTGIAALAGALSMPLLNWGDQVTAAKEAEASLEKARSTYLATLLKALEETENALTAIQTAQTRTAPLTIALSAAESAADLTMKSYRAGIVDYQNVLNTQRSLLTARENARTNEADMASALSTLYTALGGAWEATEAQQQLFLKLDDRAS